GRRLGYLGRYREAIDTFAAGIKLYPTDPHFYRHRGQRYLTIRRPALSIADFQKAASLMRGQPDEIELDGAPNARNIPLTTLHFNVWYHLAVALYVRGDYGNALMALDSASHVSVNPDTRVATTYWRYLALKRQGRDADAAKLLSIATENLDVIENGSYLKALQMFAGQTTADFFVPKGVAIAKTASDAVTAYAASMSYFFAGQKTLARDTWKRMMGTDAWPSFGVLAAEADLERAR
ncbi:MAG: tetratricopeptide repeat protein, partial [Gemmatimonadaceae bacterium]